MTGEVGVVRGINEIMAHGLCHVVLHTVQHHNVVTTPQVTNKSVEGEIVDALLVHCWILICHDCLVHVVVMVVVFDQLPNNVIVDVW